MPNVFYNNAKLSIFNQTLDLVANTIKIILLSSATPYTPNADHVFLDAGGTNDPTDAETNVTNYARGFGAPGRKTLASKTLTVNNANDRAEFDAADIAWTALGNGANQTVVGAAIIKEITNDAASLLIGYVDFTDFVTNGVDFTLQWDAAGVMHLTSLAGGLQLLPKARRRLWSWLSERLTHQQADRLKHLGVRPHIYRFAAPLNFTLKKP